jgi:hypothetical protein
VKKMSVFDEARASTEALFEKYGDEPLEEGAPVEEPIDEPVEEQAEQPEEVSEEEAAMDQPIDTVEEQIVQDEAVIDDAVDTAEVAAQAAQERDMQLQQMMQELEALKAQNQQMSGTIEELSRRNEENLIEEALEMPTLDMNGLAFATEEEARQMQEEYASKMTEFVRSGLMKELAPFLEQAKEGQYQKEKSDVLSVLSEIPELQGINDMIPQLDNIIASNRWLQSDDMDMDEKYINAYAIARGVNAMNTVPEEPKELTSKELMELYKNNPEFQELVEKDRLEAIKNSQQVPPFSASSGAVNAALNIPEKPKTFEEASERTRKMFGMD